MLQEGRRRLGRLRAGAVLLIMMYLVELNGPRFVKQLPKGDRNKEQLLQQRPSKH